MKKYYITTAIAYTSAKPHIGTVYEIILTDTIARYKRYQGCDVFFQTGTDEHGQKIEQMANDAKKTCKEFVDDVSLIIKNLFECANISYDNFIRTTDDNHKKQVQEIFEKFLANGDIYKGHYEGMYCKPCESFLTPSQLVNGKCPDCGRDVETAKEEAYFFNMKKYEQKLVEFYEQNPNFILPLSRKTEIVNNFIKKGLQDLCVSRTSFEWGIQVKSDPKHVVYVWLDALTNYITGVGYDLNNKNKNFDSLWPADLHVIGKDIARFHFIYWPIFLMALGLPLPKQIYAHGWLLQNGEKMSKSKGNVLYFDDLANLFGQDAVRYYVLSEMNFENDGLIGWELLTEKINSDLSNVYGNLVARTVAMVNKYFGGVVKKSCATTQFDKDLYDIAKSSVEIYKAKMDELRVSDALNATIQMFKRANKYIDETTPWILAKDETKKEVLENVLYNLLEIIKVGTSMLSVAMPNTANKVCDMIGESVVEFNNLGLFNCTTEFEVAKETAILFERKDLKDVLKYGEQIKEKQLSENKEIKKECDSQTKVDFVEFNTFLQTKLKVGTIIESEKVEGSDKLLKNLVKIGEETRVIVSGIAEHYSPSEVVGKQVCVVTNLKPRKIRGVESFGMLLCAYDDAAHKLSLLCPDNKIDDGCEIG